jgi:hypothetical protein
MSDRDRKMSVEISNITEAQVIAIEDMLATWQYLGSIGASRWTAFYSDGDGNFQPKVLVDGHDAQTTLLLPREHFWREGNHGEYCIDFDAIARKLRLQREQEQGKNPEDLHASL